MAGSRSGKVRGAGGVSTCQRSCRYSRKKASPSPANLITEALQFLDQREGLLEQRGPIAPPMTSSTSGCSLLSHRAISITLPSRIWVKGKSHDLIVAFPQLPLEFLRARIFEHC